MWLFLAVPWVCLQFLIVVFSDHTHLLIFMKLLCRLTILTKWAILGLSWHKLKELFFSGPKKLEFSFIDKRYCFHSIHIYNLELSLHSSFIKISFL